MDIEILLIFCLAILILGGSVLSFKNQSDIKELLKKVKSLESTVRIQASEISALQIFRKKLEASLAESAKKDNLAGDIVQETDKTLSPDPDAGSDMADPALKAVQSALDSPENILLPESGAPPVSPVTDIPNVSRSPGLHLQ